MRSLSRISSTIHISFHHAEVSKQLSLNWFDMTSMQSSTLSAISMLFSKSQERTKLIHLLTSPSTLMYSIHQRQLWEGVVSVVAITSSSINSSNMMIIKAPMERLLEDPFSTPSEGLALPTCNSPYFKLSEEPTISLLSNSNLRLSGPTIPCSRSVKSASSLHSFTQTTMRMTRMLSIQLHYSTLQISTNRTRISSI
jgi:hypothetical protein